MEATAKKLKSKYEVFSSLLREHHRELLVYIRAIAGDEAVGKDIAQDSLIVAWKSWDNFDQEKDFGTWVRGIMRNKWREYLRRQSKQVSLEPEILDAMESQMLEWSALRQDGGPSVFIKLEGCLGKLPDGLITVVKQFYFNRNSTEEAATALEISGATVRKRLERARQALKQCLTL